MGPLNLRARTHFQHTYRQQNIAELPGGKGVGVVAEGVGEDAVANREM